MDDDSARRAGMIEVSLKDFVRTGDFGGLRLEVTEAEILALLGEPDRAGGTSRRRRRPLVWKYGDLELHFEPDDDRLKRIYIDDFDIPRGSRTLVLDPWIIRRDLLVPPRGPWSID